MNDHKSIDWQAVRERLARAVVATEESLRLSPERAKAVMDERARALARVPPTPPSAAEMLELVSFALAGERYAVETRHVREVVRFTERDPASNEWKPIPSFVPVPAAPEFLLGVIDLRGEMLAVFDLRKFFGIDDHGLTELTRVIVLGGERAEFGVLADTVHEVMVLRNDEVLDPPGTVAGTGREYLRGTTKDALIVLDGAVLLGDARLFIDQGDESGA